MNLLVEVVTVRSIGAVEVPVARPAGLVLLKLHAGGPKDAWDISTLAQTHEQWPSIRDDVDRVIDRLSSDSRHLWERLRQET